MIIQIEPKDIPGRACRYNQQVMQEVEEFTKSGWDACEVSIQKYKTSHSAFAAYKQAIVRLNAPAIVFERSGRLFMVRKEAAT